MQGPALQDGLSREMADLASGTKSLLLQSAASQPFQNNAPLLQSTVTDADIVFTNIDWKASRHDTENSTEINMKILTKSIDDIVRKMAPAVICMNEVGVVSQPLKGPDMEQVRDTVMASWTSAAKGKVNLRTMFQVGSPYMTVYDANQVECSNHRILTNVFTARGERSAQAFSCHGPGRVTIDVVNVHAPSGAEKLTDKQRNELLTNLLQSNSMALPGTSLGNGSFLIGGNMDTSPHALASLLNMCRHNNVLRTEATVVVPEWAKHGDVCITSLPRAPLLQSTVPLMTPVEAWNKFGSFALRQLRRKRVFGNLGQFLKDIKAQGRIQQMAGHSKI